MNIWHNYTKINKHASSQQEQYIYIYIYKGLIRNNLLRGALFFLRGYFRVQRNLCNYLWNLKTLSWENIRMGIENMRNLGVWESVSLESVKECPRFCDLISIYRGWKTLKISSDN